MWSSPWTWSVKVPRTNDSGEVDDRLGKRPARLAFEVKPRADKLEPGGETSYATEQNTGPKLNWRRPATPQTGTYQPPR